MIRRRASLTPPTPDCDPILVVLAGGRGLYREIAYCRTHVQFLARCRQEARPWALLVGLGAFVADHGWQLLRDLLTRPPTGRTLQERYPPRPGAFTTSYSSIHLPEEAFVPTPRTYAADPLAAARTLDRRFTEAAEAARKIRR